ncbi:ATP-binding protein [Synechocystis sp. B12]|nr:ATP-binding protein [Synechocystis sp. B12]
MDHIDDRRHGLWHSPEDQQKIFERNYRGVQGRGSINGTGLGLAIVADLVAQMGAKSPSLAPTVYLATQTNQAQLLPSGYDLENNYNQD